MLMVPHKCLVPRVSTSYRGFGCSVAGYIFGGFCNVAGGENGVQVPHQDVKNVKKMDG